MVTAALHLASYGITVEEARTWVFANLGAPALIHQVAADYGVTTGMLAEIAGDGFTSDMVIEFFDARGIDARSLDDGVDRIGFLPSGLEALSGRLVMNDSFGALSTQSLRADVEARVGDQQYWELLSPNRIEGAQDGVFAAKELDPDQWASMSATREGIESLYYGTMIKLLGSLDDAERADIVEYAAKFQAELQSGDAGATQEYADLLVHALSDSDDPPCYSDDAIRDMLVESVAQAAQVVGNGGFSGLLECLLWPLP